MVQLHSPVPMLLFASLLVEQCSALLHTLRPVITPDTHRMLSAAQRGILYSVSMVGSPETEDLESTPPSEASTEKPLPDLMQGGRRINPQPFVDTIFVGCGKLAGDNNFDPLGLADSPQALAWYREAELKHARLAMLAAVGWPAAEKLNAPLASFFGQSPLLVRGGQSPSLLNGGLDAVPMAYWFAVLALAVYAESLYLDLQLGLERRSDYVPGMLGFDPLGQDSPQMREAEILNGRVAMVAIVLYAAEEAIFGEPIVRETAILFEPIWTLQGQGWL